MEEAKLQFYHVALSPPSMVVASLLGYLGIEYEDRVVDMLKREHKRQPFLSINPDGAVPAISDKNYNLNEAIAISRYLVESREIDTPFYPYKDAKAVAKINMLIDTAVADYRSKTGPLYLFTVTGPNFLGYPDPTNEEREKYFQLAFKGYDLLEKLLKRNEGDYLLGNDVTLADFYFFIFTMMIVTTTDANLNNYPGVQDWYSKIEAIPAVARVLRRRARMYRLAMFLVKWILPLTCRCKCCKKTRKK